MLLSLLTHPLLNVLPRLVIKNKAAVDIRGQLSVRTLFSSSVFMALGS